MIEPVDRMERGGEVNDQLAARVYAAAKGYGEALATHHSSVRNLLDLAERDREVLIAARERALAEAEQAAQRPSSGESDVVDEAPGLVASRLLEEAISELDSAEDSD
jgi:hypothetical protein